jgi:hypothetical protein
MERYNNCNKALQTNRSQYLQCVDKFANLDRLSNAEKEQCMFDISEYWFAVNNACKSNNIQQYNGERVEALMVVSRNDTDGFFRWHYAEEFDTVFKK